MGSSQRWLGRFASTHKRASSNWVSDLLFLYHCPLLHNFLIIPYPRLSRQPRTFVPSSRNRDSAACVGARYLTSNDQLTKIFVVSPARAGQIAGRRHVKRRDHVMALLRKSPNAGGGHGVWVSCPPSPAPFPRSASFPRNLNCWGSGYWEVPCRLSAVVRGCRYLPSDVNVDPKAPAAAGLLIISTRPETTTISAAVGSLRRITSGCIQRGIAFYKSKVKCGCVGAWAGAVQRQSDEHDERN